MDTSDLIPLIEELDDNIDDLEDALTPLLKDALSKTTGQLPLLDKAQMYVLATYAIESILFSSLRLNGVDAKEHPVFRELTRVKQYFEKIKSAESAGNAPTTKLDTAAAGRFIKHASAGNEKHSATLAQQQRMKRNATHIRFEESSKKSMTGNTLVDKSRDSRLDGDSGSLTPATAKSEHAPKTQNEREPLAEESVAEKGRTGHKRKHINNREEAAQGINALEDESKQERKKRKTELKRLKAMEET